MLTGCRITPRTTKALTRLAYMLTKPPGHNIDSYNKNTQNPTHTQLTIHPDYARVLLANSLIPTMDIRQATIPMLWQAHHIAPSTKETMDELQQYICQLKAPHASIAKAPSVRATKPDIKWILQTGYSIFMRHTLQKKGSANRSALQQLYYNYMKGKDIIRNITAEATATKHTGEQYMFSQPTTAEQCTANGKEGLKHASITTVQDTSKMQGTEVRRRTIQEHTREGNNAKTSRHASTTSRAEAQGDTMHDMHEEARHNVRTQKTQRKHACLENKPLHQIC